MVKVEDHADSDGSSDLLYRSVGASSSKWASGPVSVKEENFPSSSSSHLKSCFVGMGFSSVLVDKVIEENGTSDENLLLEALISRSKASPDASDLSENYSVFENKGVHTSIAFSPDDYKEMEDLSGPSVSDSNRSYLSAMDFSEEEINLARASLGASAPLPELVEFILTTQTAGTSREGELNDSVGRGKGNNEETITAALFGTMDKTLYLLQMGFTENEVSTAIDKHGPEVPVCKLADSIIASRMAFNVDKEEDLWDEEWDDATNATWKNKSEPQFSYSTKEEFPKPSCPITDAWITKASTSDDAWIRKESTPDLKDAWITKASSSSASLYDHHEDINVGKKAKYMHVEDNMQTRHDIKDEIPDLKLPYIRPNNGLLSKPPYFFYGNVVDVSQGTWRKLSQFLYAVQPEFVNTQFFSAFMRKEGYLHNLPTEGRFYIIPKPPMTIEDALPHTKKWWPSWDTRKQLSCINSETSGIFQLCDRFCKMMTESRGMVSKEQQTDIIHHCRRLNLVWVNQYKLRPIELDQIESILGYPRHHTEIWGSEANDRLSSLKYCFQIDTIGYHLSVLKSMYPDGLRVLSIFTGIGGAEVALHRLGIKLKCVVSVEASENNRKILKRWWKNSQQSGELRQVGGIEKMTIQTLEKFMNQFGGFDLIIGLNPGDSNQGSYRDASADMDMILFFEFVRVFQRVRSIMGRSS